MSAKRSGSRSSAFPEVASAYQRLRSHLAYLGMTTAAERLAHHLDDHNATATEVLERLPAEKVDATQTRRTAARLRFAHYPLRKTLADFDFSFQPSIDRKVVAELSTLRFVEERGCVLLLGPVGTP